MSKQPEAYHRLSPAQRAKYKRRLMVQKKCKQFEAGDPNAWYSLLGWAIDADPDMLESTKTKLHAKLSSMIDGLGSIDPISPERRKAEFDDMMIYAELAAAGGGLTGAAKVVAKNRGVAVSTVRRAYERHLRREPDCVRLDGRKPRRKRQAVLLRGF